MARRVDSFANSDDDENYNIYKNNLDIYYTSPCNLQNSSADNNEFADRHVQLKKYESFDSDGHYAMYDDIYSGQSTPSPRCKESKFNTNDNVWKRNDNDTDMPRRSSPRKKDKMHSSEDKLASQYGEQLSSIPNLTTNETQKQQGSEKDLKISWKIKKTLLVVICIIISVAVGATTAGIVVSKIQTGQ